MAEAHEAAGRPRSPSRSVALGALRAAIGRPSIWLLVWAVEALLALAPAILLHSWMADAIAHRYEPGSLFGNLDTSFRFDHREAIGVLDAQTGRIGAVLVLLSVLFGAFSAGGWLQVFLEPARGRSVQRFFLGGARFFWRFLRLTVLTLLGLSLVTWLVHGAAWDKVCLEWLLRVPRSDVGRLETLSSELTAFLVRAVQQAIYALAVGFLLVWGDYSRTLLALHDTSSAVWAGLCTVFTILRHPVRTLRPMAALGLLELTLVVAAGLLARALEGKVAQGAGLVAVAALLLIGQGVLLWRVVLRGSRYHAAVQVSRDVVPPIARPDPWRASVEPQDEPR